MTIYIKTGANTCDHNRFPDAAIHKVYTCEISVAMFGSYFFTQKSCFR